MAGEQGDEVEQYCPEGLRNSPRPLLSSLGGLESPQPPPPRSQAPEKGAEQYSVQIGWLPLSPPLMLTSPSGMGEILPSHRERAKSKGME